MSVMYALCKFSSENCLKVFACIHSTKSIAVFTEIVVSCPAELPLFNGSMSDDCSWLTRNWHSKHHRINILHTFSSSSRWNLKTWIDWIIYIREKLKNRQKSGKVKKDSFMLWLVTPKLYKALADCCECINQRIKAAKHVATFYVI